jgi:hypothetical protein
VPAAAGAGLRLAAAREPHALAAGPWQRRAAAPAAGAPAAAGAGHRARRVVYVLIEWL